jgi:hypothetical protein
MALEDVLTGAVTGGVNASTFVALNALLFAAVLALGGLLAASARAAPALVPHASFLLVLALCLWGLIFWFVASVGFTDPAAQRAELAGGGSGTDGSGGEGGAAVGAAAAAEGEEKKAL